MKNDLAERILDAEKKVLTTNKFLKQKLNNNVKVRQE